MNRTLISAGAILLYSLLLKTPSGAAAYQELAVKNQLKQKTSKPAQIALSALLNKLEAAYGTQFNYQVSLVKNISVIQSPIKDFEQNVEQKLNEVLLPTGLKCKQIDAVTYVIIAKKEPDKNAPQTPVREKEKAQTDNSGTKQSETSSTVSGTVTDEKGDLLPGVNVIVKGTQLGTVSDANGKFSITVPGENPVLTFSFIGYETLVLPARNNANLQVKLTSSSNGLNEIVVTGVAQGTNRKSLSFALTKIGKDQINTVPGLDASQTLRAKVAGIQIDQAGGNQPATVYLRGAKSVYGNIPPLLVVDGFVTTLSLSDLNPQDIESIEVVKGAAASALYGTRGEGGIIQVITKKGSGKLNIVVDNEIGNSQIQRRVPTTDYHFYKVNSDGSFALNGANRVIDYQDNGFSVNLHPYQNYYDNVKSLFRSKPYYTNFIALSTSSERYSLYTSFQNQYKGSIAVPLDEADTRQTLSFNFGFRPTKKIETEAIFQYFHTKSPSASIATPTSFSGGSYDNTLLFAALTYEPFINLTERGENGQYLSRPTGTAISSNRDVPNPFYAISNRQYENNKDNILAGAKFKYNFTDKLKAEFYGSIQKSFFTSTDYYPTGFETPNVNIRLNNGYYGVSNQNISSKNAQIQLNYNDRIGDFEFAGTLKAVYEASKLTGLNASGYTLTAPIKSLEVSAVNTRETTSSWQQTVNYGYFLNFRTSWRDKLFLDVLGRIDRSSRFGSDAATAFFPRISAAYRLTEDVGLGAISDLKIRAAYGQAGSLPPFGAKDSRVDITSSGGVSFIQNDNTNLKRAVTEEVEVGIDAVLFQRINVQANYAFANSKNDFIQIPPFPPTSGSANIYANLGAVKSNSFEVEVNGDIVRKRNFTWNAGLTFSRIRSEISSLGDVPEFTATGGFRKAVGHNPLEYFGPRYLTSLSELEVNNEGFVTNAGNGTLRPDDYTVNQIGYVVEKSKLGTSGELPVTYVNDATGNQTFLGSPQPDFILGLSNTFTVGRLSLYGVLDWKNGGYKRNRTQQLITYRYRSSFTEEALAAGLPLAFVDAVYGGEQYLWVEKSDYLSLREVSLSYNVPIRQILPRSGLIQNLKIALTGRNIFTWTSYNGVSPEGLHDSFDYPNYRIVSGKVTVSF